MGVYDSVMVKCPNCGKKNEFQSKSGDCLLRVYTLKNCPDDVLENVNRHSPQNCIRCGFSFEVDIATRTAIKGVDKKPVINESDLWEIIPPGLKISGQINHEESNQIK